FLSGLAPGDALTPTQAVVLHNMESLIQKAITRWSLQELGPLHLDPRDDGENRLDAARKDAQRGLTTLEIRMGGWPENQAYGDAVQIGVMGLLAFARKVLGYGDDVGRLVPVEQL